MSIAGQLEATVQKSMLLICCPPICCLLILVACGSTSSSPEPIPDRELSLRGSLAERPQPVPVAENRLDPGSGELQPRPFPGAPPVIPHRVDDLEPITLSENLCLDCHDRGNADDFEAPAAPPSHYRDLRQDPAVDRDEVTGARMLCTTCHVGRTTAEPLVEVRSW